MFWETNPFKMTETLYRSASIQLNHSNGQGQLRVMPLISYLNKQGMQNNWRLVLDLSNVIAKTSSRRHRAGRPAASWDGLRVFYVCGGFFSKKWLEVSVESDRMQVEA